MTEEYWDEETELNYCKYCARRTTHRAWLLTGGNTPVCESCHTNKPKHILSSRAEEEPERPLNQINQIKENKSCEREIKGFLKMIK